MPDSIGWLCCTTCGGRWHRKCIVDSMPEAAFPGGLFECVGCALFAAKFDAGENAQWDAILEAEVNVMLLMALCNAPGTGTTYAGALKRFSKIIAANFRVPENTIFPSDPHGTVSVRYVRHFIGYSLRRIRTSAVVGVISALRWWHHDKGVLSPTDNVQVVKAMKGLRRSHADTEWGSSIPKVALPMSVVKMVVAYLGSQVRKTTDTKQRRGMMRDLVWVALSTTAALRKSEAVCLTRRDVTVLTDGRVKVFICRSKTDQNGVGATLYLPGITHAKIRLASIITAYHTMLDRESVPPEGPFLGNMNTPKVFLGTARPQTDPTRAGAAYMTTASAAAQRLNVKPGDALVRRLKLHLQVLVNMKLVDIDVKCVAAHSLRRTAANEFRDACRRRGIPDSQAMTLLKAFCRWRSDKSVEVYVMEHAALMVEILGETNAAVVRARR